MWWCVMMQLTVSFSYLGAKLVSELKKQSSAECMRLALKGAIRQSSSNRIKAMSPLCKCSQMQKQEEKFHTHPGHHHSQHLKMVLIVILFI